MRRRPASRPARQAPRLTRFAPARPPRPADSLLPRAIGIGLVLGAALASVPQTGAQTGLQPDYAAELREQQRLMNAHTAPAATATPAPGPAALLAGSGPRVDSGAPVTFTADEVEYNRETGVVTARGKVEAWQGERVLRAEEFTYNRNTGVATARGNVQLLEPDGQVLFAEEAELRDQFKDGVLQQVRALLAANGRMAANGVRRTGGTVNELSRVVYSSCDLCPTDPTRPPLWQVRARIATQDKEAQRITYRDATVQVAGVPVLYTPYISHPDPSAPRASGFLFPQVGLTRFLGGFVTTPYFWAIDDSSDLTLTPVFATRQYPNLGAEYRKMFNFGEITANASVGGFNGNDSNGRTGLAGHIFARGRFTIDENWRAGFDVNRASSDTYLRTFRYEYRRVLTSQLFAEGFWGTEGYARIDTRAYQGLRAIDDVALLPIVLPNALYEYAPREAVLGGQLTWDANLLGIMRDVGTRTHRLATRLNWQRPETDPLGGLWTFRAQADALHYWAAGQGLQPINLPDANGDKGRGNFRAAVDWRMPFIRDAGSWGTQIIEPRVQFVTGPVLGNQSRFPNEDSIDFEFTEANLFALNRFTGRDRQEGGTRVDAALRGAWLFPNGGSVDGIFGRSYRFNEDRTTFYAGSGLENRGSDYVARLRVAPTSWFETLGRVRLDGEQITERRLAETQATLRLGNVTLSASYLYSPPLPFLVPSRSRDEVGAGFSARIGGNWRVTAGGRYDLGLGRPVLATGSVGYEDECFILEGRFVKRFAEDPTTQRVYPSNTMILLRIGFKTLGEYGARLL